MRVIRIGIAILLVSGLQASAKAAMFSIDQWSLDAGVHGNRDGSGVFFETVMNPFVDSGQVTDRASSASTSFNFSWDDNYGEFLIQGSQHCVAQNSPPYPGGGGIEDCG